MVCTYHFSKKKKKWQLICSNGIAEIEGKKNLWNGFVAMALPKQKRKKICGNEFMAMALPKQRVNIMQVNAKL